MKNLSVLFLSLCFLVAFLTTATAQTFPSVGQIDVNSSPVLVEGYERQVEQWKANQSYLEILRDADYEDVGNSQYEIAGNPVPEGVYNDYQGLLEQQQALVKNAAQIVEQSKQSFQGLPEGTDQEILDQHERLIEEYNETFVDNLDDPSSANKQKLALIESQLQKYNEYYNENPEGQLSAAELEQQRNELNRDSRVLTSEIINSDDAEPTITYNFLVNLNGSLYNFVKNVIFGDLADILRAPFQIAVTLWLIFIAVAMWRGKNLNSMEFVYKFGVIALVGTIVFSGGGYLFFEWFLIPLLKTFIGLSGWVLQAATFNLNIDTSAIEGYNEHFIGSLIVEQRFYESLKIGAYLWDISTEGFGGAITGAAKGAVLYLATVVTFLALLVMFTLLFAYSIFAAYTLFAMAPIFLLLSVFQMTRGFFISWLRCLLNYLCIPVIAAFSMGMTLSLLLNHWLEFEAAIDSMRAGGSDTFPMMQFITVLVTTWLSFLIHLRVPDIAASLTGGSSGGFGTTLMSAVTAGSALSIAAGKFASLNKEGGVRSPAGALKGAAEKLSPENLKIKPYQEDK